MFVEPHHAFFPLMALVCFYLRFPFMDVFGGLFHKRRAVDQKNSRSTTTLQNGTLAS